METVQFQLPPSLAKKIRQITYSNEALNRVVAEAIQQWLAQRPDQEVDREKILKTLRDAGLIMTSERQRAFAQTMMAELPSRSTPSRTEVEAVLAKLKSPLSEEIIAMRGE